MTVLERLRPHPHRGDTVAAGVVVLTVFAVVLDARFTGTWADGVRLVVMAALAALVGAMAFGVRPEPGGPRPYASVIYVCFYVLALVALGELAMVLGADAISSPGTAVWVGSLLAAGCAWLAARRDSAIMTLLAAATAVVVVNAFVDWVFDPQSIGTFRWVLLLCALALTVAAVGQRDARRRHAVSLVDAAGLAAIAIGVTLSVEQLLGAFAGLLGGRQPFSGGPAGWELVLLVFGFGLIAYGAVDRERVPAFLGVLTLGLFVFQAAQPGPGGASLVGWPLVLVLVAGALLAIGLRPRRELPPEPPVAPPPPAPPTAPTAVAEP